MVGRRGAWSPEGRAIALLILALTSALVSAPSSHAAAAIVSFDPVKGPIGATIRVTGSGFTDAIAARVGSVDAPFTVVADDALDVVVPQGAPTGVIEVDTAEGTAASLEPFTVLPNVLVIITDDQRWDTLAGMPVVQSELIGKGVDFTNAFVTNPLCCPSRASFLTGRYSHSTGVYSNQGEWGGFELLDDSITIATALDAAGYRTGLVGQYLNRYQETGGSYVPPGWDHWRAMATYSRYYDYGISIDGTAIETHGSAPEDYSTDVLAAHAEAFIRDSSAQDPLFLWFAPQAPHGPFIPATRHAGAFAGINPWRPPSYDEPNVQDKPAYIQALPRLSAESSAEIDQLRQAQLEMLLAADEAVGGVLSALSDTGRLSDTLIIFTSDNGFLWGEHRRTAKVVPYEESIRVPFVVRWDRLSGMPWSDPHLIQNIDVAPTIAEATGAELLGVDGRSLLPLLTGAASTWRTQLLFEHAGAGAPSYCAIRTAKAKFVHYGTGEEEYYRVATDPYERVSRVDTVRFADNVASLRDATRAKCSPLPPELPPF